MKHLPVKLAVLVTTDIPFLKSQELEHKIHL
jgi:hypothetical protein